MKRDYRGVEDQAFAEIVGLDKLDVDRCDALLVSYEKPSVGTSMEVLYGWERGKMVVVVAKPGTSISPWLRYHAHHICDTYRKALDFIRDNIG